MRCSFLIRHRRRSLPVFLQHGATDCAETCLAMVSCYHGRAEKSIRLSLQSNAGSSAWSLRMLVEQARRLNFETRPWALGSEELDRLTLPCILHLQHGHYVVLVALSSAHAVIHDPALGRHRLNHDQLSTAFSGVALELTPDPEFESTPKTPTCSWRSFLPRRDPTVRVLRALGFGNLMLQLPALISPLLFQQVIDAALFEGDSDALRYSFAALVALMLLDTAGAHFLAVQQTEAELRLRRHSERRLCARWLRLPTAFFDLIPSSALLARFDALASLMRETLLLHTLGPAHLLCAIGALALAASYSLPIALLCVGTALLPPILHRVQFQRTQGLVDEHLRDRSRSRHSLLETLDHLPALHAQGTAGARRRLWQQLQHSELTASALQSLHGHRLASASRLCTNAGELLLLAALVALLATQALSLGSVVALQRYRSLAQHRLALLGDLLLRRQFAHIDRRYLDAIEPELSAPSADPGTLPPLDDRHILRFENVSYGTRGGGPALVRGIELKVAEGELILLTGPSGSGKSTLLRLLLGLEQPIEGRIAIRGIDPTALTRASAAHRNQTHGIRLPRVTIADANHTFLRGTLRENLTGFEGRPDPAALDRAIHQAGIASLLLRCPLGLDCAVAQARTQFSAGELAQLRLARALYPNPDLLLLDEPTANLDPVSAHEVMQRIRALPMTRIVVTHAFGAEAPEARRIRIVAGQLQQKRGIPC